MTDPDSISRPELPDGLVAIVKQDCETCVMVEEVLAELQASGSVLTVYCQDDPAFPRSLLGVIDDSSLAVSYCHDIETVPTLIRMAAGIEVERTVGWSKSEWRRIAGDSELGQNLPAMRPGCGSMSADPARACLLRAHFEGPSLLAPRVTIGSLEDEFEATYDRGWSDGLPVVPPTELRVLGMLDGARKMDGTVRDPAEIVATVPPDLADVTVEQVAINAVMAGCKPEYMPVVLAAVAAACTNEFNMHGLIATTMHSGPIVIVNGPIADRIGMNGGLNVFGQGNRANMTIGRALQLVIRNVGGGRPGGSVTDGAGVDMSMHGSPGKLSFCFAELETGSPFAPLSVARGFAAGTNTVTLFAGQGPTPIVDQISRNPESLVLSFASSLAAVASTKLAMAFDAVLVVSPEHGRLFSQAGWDRQRLDSELAKALELSGDDLIRGAKGIDEGIPSAFAGQPVPKFRPGGLLVVHAGGNAGLFSSILSGWVGGAKGSEPVTIAID